MSVRASLVRIVGGPEGPESFRNAQNDLRDYFNFVIRKKYFCELEGIEETAYKESENYIDLAEHLYSESDDIVMTRIYRDMVEYAVKFWKGLDPQTDIIESTWGDVYTAKECVEFFEYCLAEVAKFNEYDYIYLIWA
jgi:hypothetical protein